MVVGCSFSDEIEVDGVVNQTCWGRELSKMLDLEYVHEARGCGSNYRMWRVVTTAVLEGTLTNKDLLCVQYTNNDRMEFWSDAVHREDPKFSSYEPWGEGSLVRFKDGAWSWSGQYVNERKLFYQYEQHFCNPEYNDHMFKVYHEMFQCLLSQYQIQTVFCYTRYKYFDYMIDLREPYKSWAFKEDGTKIRRSEFWATPTDGDHLNDHGHKDFADQVYRHVNSLTFKF
jgi:hypothetical protein